ncbi:hypothetical protein GCM10007424_25250 [Flavobacterium suaedae]|uniref:Uncharacterized protein n=1 Tax=Flavobacterium suaedae TaxID=1767027 RepID=A0ABQ1K216_9FLAO|nr:hypothetical protein [Flavobacterium suaedae]GGB84171.1 hypothetical protein GCM10007424_25250 [Flavobacterium suaedae]
MCNKQQIKQKITELEEIKFTYTRFINDLDTQRCVENTTWAEENKKIIKKILQRLYSNLYEDSTDNALKFNKTPKKLKHYSNSYEVSAILHFNNDKRFYITE